MPFLPSLIFTLSQILLVRHSTFSIRQVNLLYLILTSCVTSHLMLDYLMIDHVSFPRTPMLPLSQSMIDKKMRGRWTEETPLLKRRGRRRPGGKRASASAVWCCCVDRQSVVQYIIVVVRVSSIINYALYILYIV